MRKVSYRNQTVENTPGSEVSIVRLGSTLCCVLALETSTGSCAITFA